MSEDLLRYTDLVEEAKRNVVRTALRQVIDHGLPGEHCLYITFRSDHPGVDMPDGLRATYPEEMTIVLQHQFWDLEALDDRFSVSLSFAGRREHLAIPFEAMTAFADPSEGFGLKFESDGGDGEPALPDLPDVAAALDQAAGAESGGGEDEKIVTLDSFRKK